MSEQLFHFVCRLWLRGRSSRYMQCFLQAGEVVSTGASAQDPIVLDDHEQEQDLPGPSAQAEASAISADVALVNACTCPH